VIEQRQAGIVRQSYIINAFVEGPLLYVPMNDPACSQEQRQAIVSKAQRVLERLGENLMTHSDMKSANLIIHDGEPVLIDLDSMRQHRQGPYFRNRYEKMVRTFHRRLSGSK
jgi:tRNA A-37 threonylcarbamoyl transferase component Bud32